MVVFDLDGTLTPVDSLWSYLHTTFGTCDEGNDAARMYLNGELSYKEWAEADARCWSNMPVARLDQAIGMIPYRPGAEEVFHALKTRGIKTVILSAGLSVLAEKAREELGADLAIANHLLVRDGHLTGEIKVNVSVTEKMKIVNQIAADLRIPLNEIALVGDRSNDITMPSCLRIAFKPKDAEVRRNADYVIEDDDLTRILEYVESD